MLAKAIFSSGAAAVLAATVGFVTWPTWRSEPGRMEFPGVVEMHDVGLASKVCGRVLKVLVDEGDLVEPGQALVRLDAAELAARRAAQNARLEAARLRLALARRGPTPEAVAAAQAAVNAAAARCERVESGPRKEMITQTQAELRLAEVTLNEKQATLRRLEPLAKNSVVAQVDLDRARSEMQQAAALRQQAASRLEMLQKGAAQRNSKKLPPCWRRPKPNTTTWRLAHARRKSPSPPPKWLNLKRNLRSCRSSMTKRRFEHLWSVLWNRYRCVPETCWLPINRLCDCSARQISGLRSLFPRRTWESCKSDSPSMCRSTRIRAHV